MLDDNSLANPYLEVARYMSVENVADLLKRTTWRLIDSAPRDGTPVIAWDVDRTTNPTGSWVIVRWQAIPTRQAAGKKPGSSLMASIHARRPTGCQCPRSPRHLKIDRSNSNA